MRSSHGFLKYVALPLAVAIALVADRGGHGNADLSPIGIAILMAVLVALVLGIAGALEHRRADRPE
ncbi:MAG: hypothetical protein ACRDMH_01235 [Solirubrobacterales bacterium]